MIQVSLHFKFTMKNVNCVLKITLFPTLFSFLCVQSNCLYTINAIGCNAVGAALSLVSTTSNHVIPLKNTTREKAWEDAE